MKKRYVPGENVLPKTRVKKESRAQADDRRMVEEARDLSLREVGIRGPGSYERGIRHRPREGGSDTRDGDSARQRTEPSGRRDSNRTTTMDAASQARQIEHQSSLRSLLSNSDVDSSEMEEEILRQIMDEGILDGIDLNNLDGLQEDELSEKIADAYRRRRGQRQRSRDNRTEQSRRSTSRDQRPTQERARIPRQERSPNPTNISSHSSHPPLSRPHLLEAYPTGQGHRRRTSSETRRQTSPVPSSSSRASSETQRQAARSATDLSNRPQSSSNTQRQAARSATDLSHQSHNRTGSSSSDAQLRLPEFPNHGRRISDPDRLRPGAGPQSTATNHSQSSRSPHSRARQPPTTDNIQASIVSQGAGAAFLETVAQQHLCNNFDPSHATTIQPPPNNTPQAQRPLYPEPSISCDRCGKASLEYEHHESCSQCNDGAYHLCLRCYRLGRGCLHWFGFGHAALRRYEQQAPPAYHPISHPLPHRLKGHRYLRPPVESRQLAETDNAVPLTTSDPSTRLESGPFCSNCSTFAPDCFWKCDVCNEGEWGFCNSCVNQGKCCTHALLPVTLTSHINPQTSLTSTPTHQSNSTSFAPAFSSPTSTSTFDQSDSDSYTPLTFSTKCDLCTYPIPPSTTRFHCLHCNTGDYDICTSCYFKLIKRGSITADNGPNGWRRCPGGHRMIVVGFEDSAKGQRRIISKDLVGGHAFKEDDTSATGEVEWSWRDGSQQRQAKVVSRSQIPSHTPFPSSTNASPPPLLKKYPPNGGVGMRVHALWSCWPAEGVSDELAFPKGAEITECEDINGDWFWGIYCGRKGLFPGNYVRVVEVVGM